MSKYIIHILFAVFVFIIPSCDISQYKRIGDTYFYLCESPYRDRAKLYLHDDTMGDNFLGIEHEGYVKDVYWDEDYIIIKCGEANCATISQWYIMNNINSVDKIHKLSKKSFTNANDYQKAITALHLIESNINHTDGNIPWRLLHLD